MTVYLVARDDLPGGLARSGLTKRIDEEDNR